MLEQNKPHSIGLSISGKTCPQCHSYFISDNACEMCGLQFKSRQIFHDPQLRSSFDEIQKWNQSLLGHLGTGPLVRWIFQRRIDHYLFQLWHRLGMVCEYLTHTNENSAYHKMMFFELKHLVKELSRWKQQQKVYDLMEENSFPQVILTALHGGLVENHREKASWSPVQLSLLRTGLAALTLITLGAFIAYLYSDVV